MKPLSTLKRNLICSVVDNYLKFFIHISPHKDVIIGNRGLLEEEKTRGIVLVFGEHSYRNLTVSEEFISVTMKFSGKWEEVFIPYDAVVAIFNDPINPEFIMNFRTPENKENTHQERPELKHEGKVIKHDFGKKK